MEEVEDTVVLVSEPVAGREPFDGAALRAFLCSAGYGKCQIDDEALNKTASMCAIQQAQFKTTVARKVNAMVSIAIAADAMSATVDIIAPRGGKPAAVSDVVGALMQAGVVRGIDKDAIEAACQENGCLGHVVALGKAPEHGTDGMLELLVTDTVDRAPSLDSNGLIDYREHGEIPTVMPTNPLMRRIPPVPGIPGYTVHGVVLAAREGKDVHFAPHLQGTECSADDPNVLVANVNGQPVRVDNGVIVEPILRLKEVNMATGNVRFDGTVHVAGDVLQGMLVRASGDIVVDGMVEGGSLDAGGNVVVAGGVVAHSHLHAAGSVHVRFAQSAQIDAGTVIAVAESALDCTLHSLYQIVIGANAPQRGRLLGGLATAAMLLQVPWLGSTQSSKTRVIVGDHSALDEKYALLLHRIEEEKASASNLAKLVRQLQASGDPRGMLARVKESQKHAIKVWGDSLAEEVELKREIAAAQLARIEVKQGVEGSVVLTFGKYTATMPQDFSQGTFALDATQGIVFTPPGGAPVPVSARR